MTVEKQLNEEIRSELDELKGCELGTEKYKTTVDGITKLMDRAIELEKVGLEAEDKRRKNEMDERLRLEEMKKEQKDRFVKNAISVAGILIPSVITIWGTIASFQFEEEGTVTTLIGKGFVNKLLLRK